MPGSFISYNKLAGQKIHRIEALSDGVFSIAMTLLVLDIRVPIVENIQTEAQLWVILGNGVPKFISYFLSFMTLGIFWTGHTSIFSSLERTDRHLNWLTLFFLMFVSLQPFTTAFLSDHIALRTAVGIYWLNIFCLGFLLFIKFLYAERKGLLKSEGEDAQMVSWAIKERIIVAQILYATGAALCFFSTYLSIGVILVVQLNYALGIIDIKLPSKLKKL
jgi:uncharacterized membrane protein